MMRPKREGTPRDPETGDLSNAEEEQRGQERNHAESLVVTIVAMTKAISPSEATPQLQNFGSLLHCQILSINL